MIAKQIALTSGSNGPNVVEAKESANGFALQIEMSMKQGKIYRGTYAKILADKAKKIDPNTGTPPRYKALHLGVLSANMQSVIATVGLPRIMEPS